MTDTSALDPIYVVARRVLIDALVALESHRDSIIVVGAQAVYLRTGPSVSAVAPFTTDGDLALDPTDLVDDPRLEEAMRGAGFELLVDQAGAQQPGIWVTSRKVDGVDTDIPVDLIVPEAASSGAGTRGARLGIHGKRAARRAVGLEAALVDNSLVMISALEPGESRQVLVKVAGPAALLVAKMHKIHDRIESGKTDRISDKDASDVYRIMQTANPDEIAQVFQRIGVDAVAGDATSTAMEYMRDLFGRRAGEGVVMAQNALRLAIDEDEIATLSVAFTQRVLGS
jgi:hypothetical protein